MRKLAPILVAFALAVPAGAHAYGPAVELCAIQHDQIVESSGVATSSLVDDVFFTHNDSGDGERLFALDHGCNLLATIHVTGAASADWEDIARGPGSNGGSALFIADTGNNNRNRPIVTVYEIPEPAIDPNLTGQDVTVAVTASYSFVYEDGPQDVETLLVEPGSGRILVVSKALVALPGITSVYALERVAPEPAPMLARRIHTMSLALLGATNRTTTGGDVAPDGGRFVIRTYTDAFEWQIPAGGIEEAFASEPLRLTLPITGQGEAIGYTRDGTGLLTTTEGVGGFVYLIPTDA